MSAPLRRNLAVSVGAAALLAGAMVPATASAPDQQPAQKFSSCDALTKVFPRGVAKSKKAALKQVRQDNLKPAYGKRAKRTYWDNRSSLDRDKDGTACEQSA